ncbi:MAG: TonB-dependent hemoglobin/transferrin/lactoferrin family receptor [Pseudomonadota bacterium]|nr:TonB-dependent hemoglobin/transferrin/lactoferrin family receptor [Pseudomonadota bacterium]
MTALSKPNAPSASSALALAACCACAAAVAAEPADEAPGMAPITVTSTRTERRADDVPATVSVIPAATIEKAGARDIKDVFRDELDVTVRQQANRYGPSGGSARAGNESVNIRGLEGNQVLILVDGIRAPAGFAFGPIGTGRGDFLDIDSAQRIEVVRGPMSTQYGSDGLAGAVSLSTPDPADLLGPGRSGGGYARAGLATVDRSAHASVGLAGRTGAWRALLLATRRDGHEIENQGSHSSLDASRTTPNPARYSSTAALGKAIYTVDADHEIGLTLESLRRSQDTAVDSALGTTTSRGVTTTVDRLDAHDRIDRERVSLEHRYDAAQAPAVQRITTRIYAQNARTRQSTLTDRTVGGVAAPQSRDYDYAQKLLGVSTQLESRFETPVLGAGSQATLAYGADLSRTDVSGRFVGLTPPQLFPDTRYTLAGAFVQAEIERAALSVIPGLRWDRYRLAADPAGYSGQAVSLADQAVSPRLGLVWRLAPGLAPYLNLAEGFRAPAPDQVNNAFANPAHGYTSIGNPGLRPERAASLEVGLRGRVGEGRYQLTAYDNRYRDFISQQVVSGRGVVGVDPLVYQYVNLQQARIRGVEARAEWQPGAAWHLHAGAAWSRGTSEVKGVNTPLDSVEPWRAVFGSRYAAGAWELRVDVLHVGAKPGSQIASAAAFAPASYTTLDLGASWKPLPRMTLFANLYNALDRTYWRWSDVRGLAASSPVLDAYTAPGRNLRLAMRYDF